ncbi:hypothetical protein D9F99_24685, partial [Escherichia coli]|nr:hypothetical protein [Escherichia coli]
NRIKNQKYTTKQSLKIIKTEKTDSYFVFLVSENDILFYLSFSRKMQTSISYKQTIIIKMLINQ